MDWPVQIDATRMTFRVARDRLTFLLTVENRQGPPIDIRFPLDAGATLAEQLANTLAVAGREADRKPRTSPDSH